MVDTKIEIHRPAEVAEDDDPHDHPSDPIEKPEERIRHDELRDGWYPLEQQHSLHIQQPPAALVDIAHREGRAFVDVLADGLLEKQFRDPVIQTAPVESKHPFSSRLLVAIGKFLDDKAREEDSKPPADQGAVSGCKPVENKSDPPG